MFKIYSRYIWDIFEQPGETDGISIRYISSLWMVKLDRRQREERSFEEHLHHLPLSHRQHDQNHRRQLVNMIFTHPCMPWLWKAEERSRWVSSPRGLRSKSKKFSPLLMKRSLMASRLHWSTYQFWIYAATSTIQQLPWALIILKVGRLDDESLALVDIPTHSVILGVGKGALVIIIVM